MISGVTIAKNLWANDFPYDLALKTWAEVCDEIVVVAPYQDQKTINMVHKVRKELKGRCPVKIRGVLRPEKFDLFRFFGYVWTQAPDWVVHFDLDYLISSEEASKLRKVIEEAPSHTDVITYKLAYLNRGATRLVFTPQMEKHCPPHNGTHGTYPFVLNVKRQNFICPFEAIDEAGRFCNYEGVISLRPDNWGKTLYPKYGYQYTSFEVVHSKVVVEHLSFSLSLEQLEAKLKNPYWKQQKMGIRYVINGQQKYDVSYPELEEARRRYA